MKSNQFGNQVNAQYNVQEQRDSESSYSEKDDFDSNIDQQSKNFYEKVEQSNQMAKSVQNNPQMYQKQSEFKNGFDQQKDLNNCEINSYTKQTVKGQETQNSGYNIGNKAIQGINSSTQNKAGHFKQSNYSPNNIAFDNSMKQKGGDRTDNEYQSGYGFQSELASELAGQGFKQTIKGQGYQNQKMNDMARNPDDATKYGVNKAGLNDFSASQYTNDPYRNNDSYFNNSINEAAKQKGSINPFVSRVDSNHQSVLSSALEKHQSVQNNVIKRNNNLQFGKGMEGEGYHDQNIDPSYKASYQNQMHNSKLDNMYSNHGDMSLAQKQSKGIYQQQIMQSNIQKGSAHNSNSSQVIQVYDARTEKGDKGGKVMKSVPWLLLGIIGLWTFVFMISDVIDFSNWKFISENSLINVASWYSTNKGMQDAALAYSGQLGRNYISLIDFILYFFITKIFFNLWLTNDYIQQGTIKNSLMGILFLKDIVVIVLSLTSADYDRPSGWDGFGFFWLRSLGKISIILSFQKILFFRLNYFKSFSDGSEGCSGILRNWGWNLYNWAGQNNRNPDLCISLLIFCIYLPLILHCLVGLIESTYILIIWIAILFFLQQVLPRLEDKTLTQRLMERQKSGISDQIDKFQVYFTLLFVIIPGVASVSFGCNFKDSIKFHFTGQQLMFCFFSFPPSGSTYAHTMTFICNMLSLF